MGRMGRIYRCGDCKHISRLAKNKITHARSCKAVKRRKPMSPLATARKTVKAITAHMKPRKATKQAKNRKSVADLDQMTDVQVQAQIPAEGELLDRGQFITRLLAIKGGRSLHTFAPLIGVSYQFLGHVVKGDFPPGPKIAAALGFTQDVYFRFNPTLAKTAVRPAAPDKRQMKLPIEASHAASAN